MDAPRPALADVWAARVVAWHNRHPLAHRITPSQVSAMGWVDLPFAPPTAGESAGEGAERERWKPVFSERFLPALRPKAIARWALRHGRATPPQDDDAPVRRVPIDPTLLPAGAHAMVLWLATAAVQVRGRQQRVLLGGVAPFPVMGRRLFSPLRGALGALGLATSVALCALLWQHWAPAVAVAPPVPAGPQASAAPAVPTAFASSAVSPASVVSTASAPAVAASRPVAPPASAASASSTQVAAASTPLAAASAALSATGQAHAPPQAPEDAPEGAPGTAASGAGQRAAPFPPRRPLLDEAAKLAAQRELAAAQAARATAKGQPVYAVVTRRVRSRLEAEAEGAHLSSTLANVVTPRGLRVEALPAGAGWQAICWPFLKREDAERVRDELAPRGLKIEVVAF